MNDCYRCGGLGHGSRECPTSAMGALVEVCPTCGRTPRPGVYNDPHLSYCADCGMPNASRKPRVGYPATWEERLDKIASMHQKHAGADGTTSGDCNECGWSWPCATYRWATELVDLNCSWDLRECAFEDHDHEALRADAATGPKIEREQT